MNKNRVITIGRYILITIGFIFLIYFFIDPNVSFLLIPIVVFILPILGLYIMIKNKYVLDAFVVTILVISMTWLGSKVTETKYFKRHIYPESNVLDDFQVTDYAFADLRPSPELDQRIVIANIGKLKNIEIAKLITAIDGSEAKVIGIHKIFDQSFIGSISAIDYGDSVLANSIQKSNKIVLLSKLISTNGTDELNDSLITSDELFSKGMRNGYGNLDAADFLSGARFSSGNSNELRVCRSFRPKTDVNRQTAYSFAVQVANQYDSLKTRKFLARNNDTEKINFRGNVNYGISKLNHPNYPSDFTVIEPGRILNGEFEPDLFKDKIVLLGYLGDSFPAFNVEGSFITPLNSEPYKKRVPDMYGVVVHSNIIAMILNEDYILQWSFLGELIFAFFACLIHVVYLLYIYERRNEFYDLFSILIIIVQLFTYITLRELIFAFFDLETNLYFTLASLAIAGFTVGIYKEVLPLIFNKLFKTMKIKTSSLGEREV